MHNLDHDKTILDGCKKTYVFSKKIKFKIFKYLVKKASVVSQSKVSNTGTKWQKR